jgi:hypothetical protein
MKVIDKNHIKKECLMKEYIIALQQHKKYIFIGMLALLPFFYIISLMTNSSMKYPEDKMYFCTAADSRFYEHVQNLIGSIHRVHFNETQEIAVFDLGFTPEQRAHINSIAKVNVYDVEKTHPDLLKEMESRPGKIARGLWAWKPVCIKQALDKFPFVLYLDAGTTIISSIEPIFEYIKETGAFLTECGHNVNSMTTQPVIKHFNLTDPKYAYIMDEMTPGADAGLIGVSHKYYKDFIYPLYKLSANLALFEDDGTAAGGPGMGRQDQTLMNIYAHMLKIPIIKKDFNMSPDNKEHVYGHILVKGKDIPVHITEVPRQVHQQTCIFRSRSFMPWLNQFKSLVQFKNQGKPHEAYA